MAYTPQQFFNNLQRKKHDCKNRVKLFTRIFLSAIYWLFGYIEEELKLDDWVIWNAPAQVRLDCLDYTNYGANDGKLYYQILQQEALQKIESFI